MPSSCDISCAGCCITLVGEAQLLTTLSTMQSRAFQQSVDPYFGVGSGLGSGLELGLGLDLGLGLGFQ